MNKECNFIDSKQMPGYLVCNHKETSEHITLMVIPSEQIKFIKNVFEDDLKEESVEELLEKTSANWYDVKVPRQRVVVSKMPLTKEEQNLFRRMWESQGITRDIIFRVGGITYDFEDGHMIVKK